MSAESVLRQTPSFMGNIHLTYRTTGSMFKGLNANDGAASFVEKMCCWSESRGVTEMINSFRSPQFASRIMSLQSVGSNVICLSWRCRFSWQIEFSTTCQSECTRDEDGRESSLIFHISPCDSFIFSEALKAPSLSVRY